MSWSVQRQKRPQGHYYTAIFTPARGPRRCVTVGLIPGSPPPADLTARLREHDPAGSWTEDVVAQICAARAEAAVERALVRGPAIAPRPTPYIAPRPPDAVRTTPHTDQMPAPACVRRRPPLSSSMSSSPSSAPPVTSCGGPNPAFASVRRRPPARDALTPEGEMTLNDYVCDVWDPVRAAQPGTWQREQWWWVERILPALGQVRLSDLDADRWTAFLDSLTVGGRSKALCQTAYRTALRHACEVLRWIDGPHSFAPIRGATLRTLPEAEPLTMEEVSIFLDAVHLPVHRALFGVQLGQGLRPAEAIAVRWEDVDWTRGTIFVRGEKNALARATVPLTPLSRAELAPWWIERGRPRTGACFEKQGGGPFPAYPTQAFRTAVKNSGLNATRQRGLFPYVCRHSFATIAAISGIDRAFTKRMMRHSQKSTVLDEAYIRVSVRETAAAFSGFAAVGRG